MEERARPSLDATSLGRIEEIRKGARPTHGELHRLQDALAKAWLRDALGPRIDPSFRKQFVTGVWVEPDGRHCEMYLPGERPEDGIAVAAVRVTRELDVMDGRVDEGALARALEEAKTRPEK